MTKDGRDILNGTYLILVREWVRTGRLEVNSLQNLLEDKKIGFHLTVLLVYLYIESGILNQVIIKFNRRVLVVKKPFCNIDKPLKNCDEPQGCLWQYLCLRKSYFYITYTNAGRYDQKCISRYFSKLYRYLFFSCMTRC